MTYKILREKVAWQIFLIVILAMIAGFSLGTGINEWVFVGILLVLAWLVVRLVKFVQNPYKKIHYFIEAVKNEDTSTLFSTKTGCKFLNELHLSLNSLNRIIQEKSIRVRMAERYFSEILQHIGTAVLVFNEKEFVLNSNRAALNLLRLQTLTHLRQLDKVDGSLRTILMNSDSQNEKTILINKDKETLQLIIKSTVIRLREETVTLVTMQDIKSELERKELDSWLKLIKVLNHEIMNSLTPVTSIAQSLGHLWKHQSNLNVEPAIVNQTINGLSVIAERGDALMRFVHSYRMFTRMPDVKLNRVGMRSFFDRLSILISPMKEESNTDIRFIPPVEDVEVNMDEQLMVQLIINLIKNSLQAIKETRNAFVEVNFRLLSGNLSEILVVDNGTGIPDDIKDEIFVPFFTTKEDGTGIGLSYSRQIMRAHGGTIGCSSTRGRTEFYVRW